MNPGHIDLIRKHIQVISNSTKTIRIDKNPKSLKKILSEESIQFPYTVFKQEELDDSKNFLVKKIGGIGGGHVLYKSSLLDIDVLSNKDFYYQEFINGIVYSAVFLANGNTASIVGLNRILVSKQFQDQPFLYEGAISVVFKNKKTLVKIISIINKITKRTELFGLCGIDFIIDENQSIFVIDINPRPTATFELHESQESLFAAHIKSFNRGPINYISYNHNFSKGYVIYYAKENLLIPENLKWPSWVKDRPYDKQMILIKNPVCTIHAEGVSEQQVENKLINRLKEIELFIKSI